MRDTEKRDTAHGETVQHVVKWSPRRAEKTGCSNIDEVPARLF